MALADRDPVMDCVAWLVEEQWLPMMQLYMIARVRKSRRAQRRRVRYL